MTPTRGRCDTCYQYWHHHGAERPPALLDPRSPRPCQTCGQRAQGQEVAVLRPFDSRTATRSAGRREQVREASFGRLAVSSGGEATVLAASPTVADSRIEAVVSDAQRERRVRCRPAGRAAIPVSHISCRFLSSLRTMDLLVPYAEGGSLSELHELAGDVERADTAEGVRVKARVPVGVASRFERFEVNGRNGAHE